MQLLRKDAMNFEHNSHQPRNSDKNVIGTLQDRFQQPVMAATGPVIQLNEQENNNNEENDSVGSRNLIATTIQRIDRHKTKIILPEKEPTILGNPGDCGKSKLGEKSKQNDSRVGVKNQLLRNDLKLQAKDDNAKLDHNLDDSIEIARSEQPGLSISSIRPVSLEHLPDTQLQEETGHKREVEGGKKTKSLTDGFGAEAHEAIDDVVSNGNTQFGIKSNNRDNSSKIGRSGHRNFSDEDRKLLFTVLENSISSNKIPPRQGFNWEEITNEFNFRNLEAKNITNNNEPEGDKEDGPGIPRTEKALKRYLHRLARKASKYGLGNKENASDESVVRAAKLVEWEERNKKYGHSTSFLPGAISGASAGGLYTAEANSNGHTVTSVNTNTNSNYNTNSLHRFEHSLPHQSPRFLYSGHTPGVATGANTPSYVYSQSLQRKQSTYHGGSENEADIEDDDDDVQSKHSHTTTKSENAGDMQISQLLNDVYGTMDLPSFSQSYNNNEPILDGMFTPHGPHGNYNKDSAQNSHNNSARKRRPTTSSTGYESGSRKRLRHKMSRGFSQDGTEFINFSGGMPSTPGQTFTANPYTTGNSSGIINSNPLNGGLSNLIDSTEIPGNIGLGANAANGINYNGKSDDLIMMKDKMIVQLQSTVYTILQDLKHANERIKHLTETEINNVHNHNVYEQRHINEVRTMEVVHREQLQDYEIKINSLETRIRKMQKHHQREINRVIKFVPVNQRKDLIQRMKNRNKVYPYISINSTERNQNMFESKDLNNKMTSPPPFNIPSPIIPSHNSTSHGHSGLASSNNSGGNTNHDHHHDDTSNSSSNSSSSDDNNSSSEEHNLENRPLLKLGSRSRSLSPQSVGYNNWHTGAGSMKKSSANQQTKSVKLLSRDTIIKDNFSREESSSSDSSSFSEE